MQSAMRVGMREARHAATHALMACAALLFVLPTARAATACTSAEIVPLAALDFGRVALKQGGQGWLWLDHGGGHTGSGPMQSAGRSVPSVARMLLRARPGEWVWLEARIEQPEWAMSEGRALLTDLELGTAQHKLALEGNTWLVRMPAQALGDTGMAQVELTATAALHLSGKMRPVRASWRIVVTCVRQQAS